MSAGVQIASMINLPLFSVFFVDKDPSTEDPAAEGGHHRKVVSH